MNSRDRELEIERDKGERGKTEIDKEINLNEKWRQREIK